MAAEEVRDVRLDELIRRFEEAALAYRDYIAAIGGERSGAAARLEAALRAVAAAQAALDEIDR